MSFQFSAPQPLLALHRVDEFACGEALLDEWLKRRALANQPSGASRTFVVTDQDRRVCGTTRSPLAPFRTRWPRVPCGAICRTPCR